jgi:hypothetical protein
LRSGGTPLKDFDGKTMTKDWAQAPAIPGPTSEGGGETKWSCPRSSSTSSARCSTRWPPGYNNEHFFDPNAQKRYSLGTENKNLRKKPDGSLTPYVGARSPETDKESNWLPAPNGHFSLYIRSYWGQPGILDGSWRPPVIRKVE